MGLGDYSVNRDKFEYGDDFYNREFDFPCCVCKWNQCDCAGEPCRTCDHNVQAVDDMPNDQADRTAKAGKRLRS